MIKNLLFGAVIPVLLIAVGIGAVILLKRPDPGKKPPVLDTRQALLGQLPAAEVAEVRALGELSETLDIPVSGVVVPFREITLAAEVSGRIVEKSHETRSGNVVHKGDVLYRIDPRDYELELARLQQRLEQERAVLAEQVQDIANAERLLEVAEQELALAESDVKRFESLGGGFSSQAELDQAKRSRLASMNQRVSVQNQLSQLKARRARLDSAIKLAQTELEQAQLNLDRTVIRSPVDGRVVTEQVEADSYVQKGTSLLVIEDTEKVEVACNLRMDQLYWILDKKDISTDQLVNAAQASRYALPNVPVKVQYTLAGRDSLNYEWRGRLDRYDGAGFDPQSRTVPVRVLVEDPGSYQINGKPANESNLSGPSSLIRGMFVEVVIQAKPSTPLFLVPKLSVKPATGRAQIWKFRPDEKALDETRAALRKAGNLAPPNAAEEGRDASVGLQRVVQKPEEWQAGFLTVIDGVQVIGPYEGTTSGLKGTTGNSSAPNTRGGDAIASSDTTEIEYWICEVAPKSLSPGDQVVVTPLPGVEAEGDEAIRVRKLP